MPLVRISVLKTKPVEQVRAIANGVHQALIEAYNIPPDDRFQLIHRHEPDEFIYDTDYLGIHRSDELVMIQIVAGNWRDVEKKKALYAAIAAKVTAATGMRAEDVLVVLTPNGRDEWSFGNGLASYVEKS